MRRLVRIVVGERRWVDLSKLPVDRVPICPLSGLGAVEVFKIPELEPDDAFAEYSDGSMERIQ